MGSEGSDKIYLKEAVGRPSTATLSLTLSNPTRHRTQHALLTVLTFDAYLYRNISLQINMIMAPSTRSFCVLILILSACFFLALSDDQAYAKSLLRFRASLTNAVMLDGWQEPVANLCSWNRPVWKGCLCINGSFVGLRLEDMGLGGNIDIDSLSELPVLSFSVMNNNFSGPFPRDINKLGNLRSLYLANNSFSGEIPDDAFSGMKVLRRVVLGKNLFTGRIPSSLLGLPKLVELQLQDNQFTGKIPDFRQANLTVNVSNNKLDGAIPAPIRNLNASSFWGNTKLCGEPLSQCKLKQPLKNARIIAAAVVGFLFLLAVIGIFLLLCRRHAKPLKYKRSSNGFQTGQASTRKGSFVYKTNDQSKLHFVRNEGERFELENLLRAPAEILGTGRFGSSYKVVLSSGQAYVVRRFKQMSNVGRMEFFDHMRLLGQLSHPNLLPLMAFYYRKEEKLLVNYFIENRSLASHLHGKRSPNHPGLDWPTRLRIIKGVARGMAYLYKELPTLSLPHGHLKSSNILLDTTYRPLIADYSLAPVINKDHAQQFMVAYKSTEAIKNGRVTRKTDVWNLGILILELLTGRFPANYLKRGRGPSPDLVTWVNSVLKYCTAEVFDKDMNMATRSEGQMLRLLEIGVCCCEWDVEKRWDLTEAVEKIEELKERDSEGVYSSFASEDIDDDDLPFSKV